tara:strand:+ start:65163 stop:66449 length:1287 start_codon:yes stop_codon:yes gene_type:complete
LDINGGLSVKYNTEDWVRHGQELRRPLLVHPSIKEGDTSVIIGGGLSGMVVGYRIAKKSPQRKVIIIEKKDHLGGTIETWKSGDWLCDVAVSSARPHPAFWRLVNDLELGDSFHESREEAKERWVFLDGEYIKMGWKIIFKIGIMKLLKSLMASKRGGLSVSELVPNKSFADAMTLGIVNQYSENVDADFLFPSLTKFGDNPPLGSRRLAKKIRDTYPLFTPNRGSFGSFECGMTDLTDKLARELDEMPNVSIILGSKYDSLTEISQDFGVPIGAIIWSAPGILQKKAGSDVSVFAVGYRELDVSRVPVGYGTLYPDNDIVFSGVLHESDVHVGRRAPSGHRLFRLMVPTSRWSGDDEEIIRSLKENFVDAEPVLFQKIGDRSIPSYEPGYMKRITNTDLDCSVTGWAGSGVSIIHVVDEAERISEMF